MGRIKNQRFEDLTGKKFNSLKVLSFNKNQKGTTYWNCECECGNLIVTRGSSLKSGYKKSCGHEKNKLPKDIEYIGETDESYSNGEKRGFIEIKKQIPCSFLRIIE